MEKIQGGGELQIKTISRYGRWREAEVIGTDYRSW